MLVNRAMIVGVSLSKEEVCCNDPKGTLTRVGQEASMQSKVAQSLVIFGEQ